MTLEEIKAALPQFMKWKSNIALLYGALYAEKYCTWERFNDHLKVLKEINEERSKERSDVIDLFPESLRDEIRKKEGFGLYENKSNYQET
jgi:hypothetical protein